MIKRGQYGIYQGKEYSLGSEDGEFVNLISRDYIELKHGFIPHPLDNKFLSKKVKKEDLEKAYYITPYVIYKGREFGIAAGDGSTSSIIIGTTYKSEADELGMRNVNKSEYELEVELKDVQLMEERKPIWGFSF
ncbi:hypothetical protein [Priestia taiwanensis]|uniref:Uncharacterized protein n=1 Tax=Priestia taiwanensis TaxID=1347902 RepID=A0A917EMY0_9BACI|nr:hypothetical protein [Priestia taiwanensis]MBM7362352.1 hypothetical protein [Priestia taiwanensis]GGE61463.1 hypothetical protein GCM10007140_09740 [Priestia taiwanensis]